ncbi:hypothetical protein Aph02nite_66500 [Actinoplanes philippinensis]|uniref:DUF2071 domain-containing protein n=1 Tax=Actinoplanes philippinensis TaxID=35752 RepID=UPI000B8991E9|nr:DUF2071 domain-containing protein [Actinoplanes philippinensis]GIE80700.1 hypothetical protein Aph02nite_66500 [Actinoplanes philippinensis]
MIFRVAVAAAGVAAGAEMVLRRRRPRTAHGRYADWAHPGGPAARPLQALANSRAVRAACEVFPVPAMVSDITDVVYVNYAVPADRLLPLVPRGLELQRIGPGGDWAVFTFLTYRHGHLGPAVAGGLRRLLPSPVQTNWRVYVHDRRSGHSGVHFVTTAIDRAAHALGGRLLCEALPMHLLRHAAVGAVDDEAVLLRLDPGRGSGPDAEARLTHVPIPADGPWRPAFDTYEDMLAYVVPQDRALSVQPWHRRVTRQEIRLDLSPADCLPLAGPVRSAAARALAGDAEPFSFHVRGVTLRVDAEEYDDLEREVSAARGGP